ncbi:hypothetical protein ElyMa_003334600 [Elysia marginata]|uniref:Uncharacterized protein n=1 Tax=Elysia marginata TaxID=1093978 RepID=A0AAV4JFU8_9GAST|nr:hypothetical protein ElyMa_003334600 [Elysia marginata]
MGKSGGGGRLDDGGFSVPKGVDGVRLGTCFIWRAGGPVYKLQQALSLYRMQRKNDEKALAIRCVDITSCSVQHRNGRKRQELISFTTMKRADEMVE